MAQEIFKQPSVAILLAAYNGDKWIYDQIQSILRQRHVEVTIFISVDRSTDSTLDIVRSVCASDSHVICLSYGERYGSAEKNFYRLLRDVDFSGFDYVALSDQDDVWYLDKLSRAINSLIKVKACAYSSNVNAFWSPTRQTLIDKSQPQKSYDYFFEAAGPGCTYVFPSLIAKYFKDFIIRKITEGSLDVPHDWLLYAYIRSKGYSWHIDSSPTMDYRQHDRNVVGANIGLLPMWVRLRQLLFEKTWSGNVLLIAESIGQKSNAVIKKFISTSVLDKVQLAFHAKDCRRRLRDQIAFFIVMLFLALKQLFLNLAGFIKSSCF